jgi:hypothetical protein
MFLVPGDDGDWPSELWGMKLGRTVCCIRGGRSYLDRTDKLDDMGFDFNPQRKSYGWVTIKLDLETYKEIYGDLQVPSPFVVPEDRKWHKELWGMKLGSIVDSIRKNKY